MATEIVDAKFGAELYNSYQGGWSVLEPVYLEGIYVAYWNIRFGGSSTFALRRTVWIAEWGQPFNRVFTEDIVESGTFADETLSLEIGPFPAFEPHETLTGQTQVTFEYQRPIGAPYAERDYFLVRL